MSNNKLLSILVTLLISLFLFSYNSTKSNNIPDSYPDLNFVKNISFPHFMGIWYNIASLPNIIEKDCKCPQTLDTLESELTIDLSQSCLIFGYNITSKSKAIANSSGNGDWTNWNGPLKAPYWVIKLDDNYQWTIIGQPSRKGFWIMSRKPTMQKEKLQELIKWGEQQQFNLTTIEFADQSCFTTIQEQ